MPDFQLPEGEIDKNNIYIAVGNAIHIWEELELALASLYLKLCSINDIPPNLAKFGASYGIFRDRMAAINVAADRYFVRRPNQCLEGTLSALVGDVVRMSIERHRVAHGHLAMSGSAVPTAAPDGSIGISFEMRLRWAAPFYATTKLMTDPFGKGVAELNSLANEFEKLWQRTKAFTNLIEP